MYLFEDYVVKINIQKEAALTENAGFLISYSIFIDQMGT